ncbi:hypothetical protein [Priestia aryabhattai]
MSTKRKHIRKDRERKEIPRPNTYGFCCSFYQYALESEWFLRQDVDNYIEETILKKPASVAYSKLSDAFKYLIAR